MRSDLGGPVVAQVHVDPRRARELLSRMLAVRVERVQPQVGALSLSD